MNFFPIQHNVSHGFIQGKFAMIHLIVDNRLLLVRSGVLNIASNIVIVVKFLTQKAIFEKLSMSISISDKWKMGVL